MLSFVDNHDVSRIASVINNEKNLPLAYAFIFGMPGIPCVYYGSEWGFKADKSQGDPALRPYFENYEENALTDIIAGYAKVKKKAKPLITAISTVFYLLTDSVFSEDGQKKRQCL